MRGLVYGVMAAAALASASALSAAIVYDNGLPNQRDGNEATEWVQAEDFVLSAPGQIASAGFWTIEKHGSVWDGNLSWNIFADSAGQPGSSVFSGIAVPNRAATTNINVVTGFYDEFRYEFNFPGTLTLAAGSTYWLGLHLSKDFNRDEIYWEGTSTGQGFYGHQSDGGTFNNWNVINVQHAFFLSSTPVPEPASAVAVLGTSALLVGRRMRKS